MLEFVSQQMPLPQRNSSMIALPIMFIEEAVNPLPSQCIQWNMYFLNGLEVQAPQ